VQIEDMISNNPTISTWTVARNQEVSQASVCRALKSAHFHPYKITLTQELHINEEARRLRYCRWFINVSEENCHFSKHILFSDECIFHNNGNVNRHNLHYFITLIRIYLYPMIRCSNEAPFSCRHSLNRFSKFSTVEIKIIWGMLRQTLVIWFFMYPADGGVL